MNEIKEELSLGHKVQQQQINMLRFADDTALPALSKRTRNG